MLLDTLSRSSLLTKVAALPQAEWGGAQDTAAVRRLILALKRHRRRPELPAGPLGTPLARSLLRKSEESGRGGFSVDDLLAAGFVPSRIAVPETGQASFVTYRHPYNNFHIHNHDDSWIAHEDTFPSTQMLMERRRLDSGHSGLATSALDAIRGMPHALAEGVPGYLTYAMSTLRGRPGFRDRILRKRRREEGEDPSPTSTLPASPADAP